MALNAPFATYVSPFSKCLIGLILYMYPQKSVLLTKSRIANWFGSSSESRLTEVLRAIPVPLDPILVSKVNFFTCHVYPLSTKVYEIHPMKQNDTNWRDGQSGVFLIRHFRQLIVIQVPVAAPIFHPIKPSLNRTLIRVALPKNKSSCNSVFFVSMRS